MDEKKTELVPVSETRAELPPILAGRHTAAVEAQVRSFYLSVADIFERWVTRHSSAHTQRAYRQDVMDFVRFLGIRWPNESTRLFTVSVADVLAFRNWMLAESKAPKTINRRIASLSSFYKYLQGVASEFRLPSRFRIRRTPSSLPEARRTRATRPKPSRRRVPGSHGAPLGRHGVRLPRPGDHQVLPLQRGEDRNRVSPPRQRLPPGRRRDNHHASRKGRQAPPHRAALRGGGGHRGVHREGRTHEGAALSRPAQLAESRSSDGRP